ncbi:MAG: glycosyltransferase family 61 protein [Rubellimicrobium sp.]|nr:glycosyltransferase family 61 protein [Rubellimicrobium sp.]
MSAPPRPARKGAARRPQPGRPAAPQPGVVRQTLFPPAAPPPPAPLLWRAEMPPEVIAAHDAAAPRAVELVTVTGALFGGLGLLHAGGTVAHVPGLMPDSVGEIVTRMGTEAGIGRRWRAGLGEAGTRILQLESPAILAVHPNWVYGHVLLEMVPRALVLDGVAPPDWPVLVPRTAADWAGRLLRMAMPRRSFVTYDPADEAVAAPAFLGLTDLVRPDGARAEAGALFAALAARVLDAEEPAPGPRHVYLSRAQEGDRLRRVLNLDEIEDLAREMGFAVLRPERLPLADQVRLMRGARLIAGEFGSAMHNTVFARPGTVVICLNWVNGYQSQIARMLGQPIGYVAPQGGVFRDAAGILSGSRRKMRFARDHVRDRLEQAMALAAQAD